MKKRIGFICMVMAFLLLFPNVLSVASFSDYADVAGHWAESELRQAYNDGLLDGYDGYLFPNASVTSAQTLAILCRVLDARTPADISDLGISNEKWYHYYVERAVYLGLTTAYEEAELEAPITRQNAFYLLAEAFQLIEANPDMTALEQFSDYGQISGGNRQALASLISQGLIGGYDGKLGANDNMTRASFVTMIYRIAGRLVQSSAVYGNYDYGALIHGSARLNNSRFSRSVWFDCAALDISLSGVSADKAIVRSHTLNSLVLSDSTRIRRLTLAALSGDITVSPETGAVVDTLIIGSGGGIVSTEGIDAIEVIGNNRRVTITDSAKTIVVSGRNSTVRVEGGAHVERIELLAGAHGSHVIADGTVDEMGIMSIASKVSGNGYVGIMTLYRADTEVSVSNRNEIIDLDIGLVGATVSITAPATLPAGNTLNATATIYNAVPGTVCELTWFINDAPVYSSSITTGGAIPGLTRDFEYSRSMAGSANIKVTVGYVTALGEQQEISAESTVRLENYSSQHWMELDASSVLERVTLGYLGNYTLEWALANDLDDYDKEVWINAKGYTSRSEYLLWINLAYQRVNIFKRTGGSWELIRTCIVGTGAPGRGTPPGVWTTSYKQLDGWTTATYTVKPVVRFRDSSGYAFHSRLYYPNTTTIQDPSIGYPISRGCIRMYDEDIWFIYDNIPDGTTVVVY